MHAFFESGDHIGVINTWSIRSHGLSFSGFFQNRLLFCADLLVVSCERKHGQCSECLVLMLLCNGRRSAQRRPCHAYVYWDDMGAYTRLMSASPGSSGGRCWDLCGGRCLPWLKRGRLIPAPGTCKSRAFCLRGTQEPNLRQGPTKMNLSKRIRFSFSHF